MCEACKNHYESALPKNSQKHQDKQAKPSKAKTQQFGAGSKKDKHPAIVQPARTLPNPLSSYVLVNRIEYEFEASQNRFAKVLDAVAEAGVNLVSTNVVGSTVRIIVGPPGQGSKSVDAEFEQILEDNRISFAKHRSIQIYNLQATAGTPGAFRIAYNTLNCAGIEIENSYAGEPAPGYVLSRFFRVAPNQFRAARAALAAVDLSYPLLCDQEDSDESNDSNCSDYYGVYEDEQDYPVQKKNTAGKSSKSKQGSSKKQH